ncbi:hypothetical protein JCM11491_005642 [Sporobolomyces phaffii]
MTTPPPPRFRAHLLVVLHGLWGSPSHVRYIGESALKHHGPSSSDDSKAVRLVVLNAKLNEFTATYDGIDLCAERVLHELDQEVERIEHEGGTVERFSIVGYSLGGLVARYVLGLLDSRTPSFFDHVRPVNFATFASPAIGIPSYETFWSSVFRFLGARLLSRSGAQLYENDRFLPSQFNPSSPDYSIPTPSDEDLGPNQSRFSFGRRRGGGGGGGRRKKKEQAEPLLKILADPEFSFYRALAKFERIEVFANTVNDRTVPFPTGAFELHDPFALARAKARKAAEQRGDDPEGDLDFRDGGLEIILHEDAPIVSSYRVLDATANEPGPQRKRRFNVRLPLLLRPTTYPFPRAVSLVVIALLPVALPLSVVVLVARFLVQGRDSKRRIRALRAETAGDRGRAGMLERVGVRVREVAEQVGGVAGPDTPEYAAAGDLVSSDSSGGEDDDDEQDALLSSSSTSRFRDERTPATSGASTPALLRGGSPPRHLDDPAPTDSTATNTSDREQAPYHAEARQYSTDPVFTASQRYQLAQLNALPQLRKHFVYLPQSRNSHGAIVRRSPEFEQHRIGTKVVDWWARQFVL